MTAQFAGFHYEPAPGRAKPPEEWDLTGLDRLQRDVSGQGAAPPIAYLCGMRPTAAAEGHAEFTTPVTEWLRSDRGEISSTAAAFLCDAPIGGAIMTALPSHTAIPTAELSLTYLEPAGRSATSIVGQGTLLHVDGTTAASKAEVVASGGTVLAVAATRVVVQPIPPGQSVPTTPAETSPEEYRPYLDTVIGGQIPSDVSHHESGLAILSTQASGEMPLSPVASLLGVRPTEVSDGKVQGELILSGWAASPAGTVYGGTVAAAADIMLAWAGRSVAPPRVRESMLDLKVNYFRPLAADGSILGLFATLIHRGRRIVAGEVTLVREDGKLAAKAVGTVLLIPNGFAA